MNKILLIILFLCAPFYLIAEENQCENFNENIENYEKITLQTSKATKHLGVFYQKIVELNSQVFWCIQTKKEKLYLNEKEILLRVHLSETEKKDPYPYLYVNLMPRFDISSINTKYFYTSVLGPNLSLLSAQEFVLGMFFETPYNFERYKFLFFEFEGGVGVFQRNLHSPIISFYRYFFNLNLYYPLLFFKNFSLYPFAGVGISYELFFQNRYFQGRVSFLIKAGLSLTYELWGGFFLGAQSFYRFDLNENPNRFVASGFAGYHF